MNSVALALALFAAGPAGEGELLQRAQEHYDARRFEAAAADLRELIELNREPVYVYALAQALRQAGDCRSAIGFYEEFLDSGPAPTDEAEAKDYLAQCRRLVPEEPPPPQPRLVAPPPPPPRDEPPPRPWYRDPAGATLVGIGVPLTAIGAGLLGAALVQQGNAADADTEQEFDDTEQRIQRMGPAGIVVLSVGVTTALAGVIRWAVVARRASAPR